MSEQAELLFANDAFYNAFRTCDLAAMERLWSARDPIACIHPGWRALTSRAAVMESWRGILTNPGAPRITCREARASRLGDVGFVICYEVIGESVLAATNGFVREGGAWRMIHHQAGPCELAADALADEPERGPLQ